MGNRNFNQAIQSLIQYMMREKLLSREEEGRLGYLKEQQQGQRQYLGEQQAGARGLEELRTSGDERLAGVKHGISMEEESVKHTNAMDRLKQAYVQDLSKLPPVSQMQAQIFQARESGAPPEQIAPLEENLKGFVKDHMASAYKALAGTLDEESTGKIMMLGDDMSRLLMGQGGASMRQKEDIAKIKEPEQKIRRDELAVKRDDLARVKKTENPTLKYIEDAMKHIQEQGVTPSEDVLSPSAQKAPSTLSKENYGAMLRHLQKLRVKSMRGAELTDEELDWIAKAYDATSADREGVLGPGETRPPMPDISGGFGDFRKIFNQAGAATPTPLATAQAPIPAPKESTDTDVPGRTIYSKSEANGTKTYWLYQGRNKEGKRMFAELIGYNPQNR